MRGARRLWLLTAVLVTVSSPLRSTEAAPDRRTLSADTSVFRTIARQHNPSVVAIRTTKWIDPPAPEDVEWYQRFFGRAVPRGPQLQREAASGVLISPDGDILTNAHVVADVDVIEVRLFGRETITYRATVVGSDPISDSAVIRLVAGPPNLPVAVLGDSDSLETGDWVMTIGNPYQLGHSVTVGVVSYVGRSFEINEGNWQKLIQTDASINPGSSGGPLLNAYGEVIGISLAMLADGGEPMGIGFAIPINSIRAVLPGLLGGHVTRGTIGARLRHTVISEADAHTLGLPAARGALITSIERRSSAEAAGLRPSDVIVEFLGSPIHTAEDLMTRIMAARPGVRARATVIHDGHTRAVEVVIAELPPPPSRHANHAGERAHDSGLRFADDAGSPRDTVDGARVERVEDGSIADNAGIEPGDVIRKINQRTIRTAAEADREFQDLATGHIVFLLVWRDGDERLVEIEID